jgi:hypothetical protein
VIILGVESSNNAEAERAELAETLAWLGYDQETDTWARPEANGCDSQAEPDVIGFGEPHERQ